MREREDQHFDIDDEFLGESEESQQEFEPVMERQERRPRPVPTAKRGKAAWSRVEDVIADRELERELRDVFEDE